MASGVLSQIVEAECLSGEISNPNPNHTKQPLFCRLVRLHQIGAVESADQTQPLRIEVQAVYQRLTLGFLNPAATQAASHRRVR